MCHARNGDGFIDREEFGEIIRLTGEGLTEQEVDEMMADSDANKDGKIDFDGEIQLLSLNCRLYACIQNSGFQQILTQGPPS